MDYERGTHPVEPSLTEQVFCGPVLDGPWKGDYIKADSTPIPYVNAEGQYGFSEVAKGWYWLEAARWLK